MKTCKPIRLELNSNISNYTISVRSCDNNIFQRISKAKDCIYMYTRDNCLKVIVSPIDTSYNTKLYYKINIACKSSYSLNFRFTKRMPSGPSGSINRFFLRDKNYGLRLSGTLTFSQT